MMADLPHIQPPAVLQTTRLILRPWQESDLAPFAAMNADPEVMEFFPSVCTREQSDAIVSRISGHNDTWGWSFWATELRATGEFIGFIGLQVPRPEVPAYPCVEVGWRLTRSHWGQGYATEGARASLTFGFETLGLQDIVAFVAEGNLRSRAVMARLGMQDQHQPFIHPLVTPEARHKMHCLYQIRRTTWQTQ